MGAYQTNLLTKVPNPLFWLKLDVTPYIQSGSGTTTVFQSGTVNFVNDPATSVDTAHVNPSQNGYLGNNSALSIHPGRSLWTLNFWFKKNSLPSANLQYIYYVSGAYSFTVANSYIGTDGKVRFAGTYNSIASPTLTSTTNICDGDWHMVTITRSTNAVFMYIDGVVEANSLGFPTNSQVTTGFIRVASNNIADTDIYYDEINATNAVWNGTQILGIYNGYVPPVALYPLKYWDGATWATPISKSQWDGSNWVTFNGKIWDGSAWQDIT